MPGAHHPDVQALVEALVEVTAAPHLGLDVRILDAVCIGLQGRGRPVSADQGVAGRRKSLPWPEKIVSGKKEKLTRTNRSHDTYKGCLGGCAGLTCWQENF